MAHWKELLSRLMFSTVWVLVLTGLGGFLGAIAGAVLELMLQAFLGFSAAGEVIPLVMLAGGGWAFLWALREAIVHRQVPSRIV